MNFIAPVVILVYAIWGRYRHLCRHTPMTRSSSTKSVS
jgi:hypothetical protein